MPEAIQVLEASELTPLTADQAASLEHRTDVTVDELERLSLPYPAELHDGKVVCKKTSPAHGIVQSKIAAELRQFVRKHRLGYVMTETSFRLWPDRDGESRLPDVAFVRKERMPKDLRRFPAIAPDLAVEIVSSNESFDEVVSKVNAYLEQGAQLVWLVAPGTRKVFVCTSKEKFNRCDVLTAPDLLPGFELPVASIFEELAALVQS